MALWLGHIVMSSARHAARALPGKADGAAMPRRRFLLVFLRTLIFAAAVTSLPRSLRAQSCNCYSDTDCLLPAGFPAMRLQSHRPARRYAAARTMSAAPGRPSRGAARQTPASYKHRRAVHVQQLTGLLSAWLGQPLAFIDRRAVDQRNQHLSRPKFRSPSSQGTRRVLPVKIAGLPGRLTAHGPSQKKWRGLSNSQIAARRDNRGR